MNSYYSTSNLLKLKLLFKVLKNQNKFSDYSRTYIVTGMPRGGTTWMAEILNTIPNSLYLHEPLKKGRIKAFQKIDFDWHQYIPENAKWPEAKGLFDKLFTGKILNPALVERSNNLRNIPSTENLVIKFVRLNRMLPWIINNFQGINPPVYIIRHPCAIVYSQLNHNAWNYARQISYPYKPEVPKSNYSNFYTKIFKEIRQIKTIEQHLSLAWCLDTLPLFHEYNNKKWITVSYEFAVQNKLLFIEKLFQRLNLELNDRTELTLNSPSSSTQIQNPLMKDSKGQITKWMKKLSKNQIDQINEILNIFGIDFYTVKNPEPDHSKMNKKIDNKLLER